MSTVQKLINRYVQLGDELARVKSTLRPYRSDYGSGFEIDQELFLGWKIKARHLIGASCGEHSEYYREFIEQEKPVSYSTYADALKRVAAVLAASRETYETGYITSVRSLVSAELFDHELDQARELLRAKYTTAAAVIAGVVLETALRELCLVRSISTGKLDRMNADLAKAGQYNLFTQKKITALADLRNNAAHGNSSAFGETDIVDMIAWVERFLADNL